MTPSPTIFLGLTQIGIVHTAVALIALICGFWSLFLHREIRTDTRLGQIYLATTFVAAATSFGLFQHGGFGRAHVLAILTIAALVLGLAAPGFRFLGGWARPLRAFCFSATILFHLIPGLTETLTRLPLDGPFVASPESPLFRPIYAGLLLVFLGGAALQLLWLRRKSRQTPLARG